MFLSWEISPATAFEPGKTYDGTNYQEIEEMLVPSLLNWVKKGEFILPTAELNFEWRQGDAYRNAGKENEGKFDIDDKGMLVWKKDGSLVKNYYGNPFPTIDPGEPNAGAKVIAADLDHDCIEQVYLNSQHINRIHPVVLNVGDMLGGKGFAGQEFPSFTSRVENRIDIVMMLALIHHLTISEGIHLSKVAGFAHRLTRDFLVVEFVDHTDPMSRLLAQQRNRETQNLSLANQREEFARFFATVDTKTLPISGRVLALLRKRSS